MDSAKCGQPPESPTEASANKVSDIARVTETPASPDRTGAKSVRHRLTLLFLTGVAAISVYAAVLAIMAGETPAWFIVPGVLFMVFVCLYVWKIFWDRVDPEIMHLEGRLKKLWVIINSHLERFESRVRRSLSRLGIAVRPLTIDQRQGAFFIFACVIIVIAVQSPYLLYRYEDNEEMVLRTNRFTRARQIRFTDEEQNAAIVFTLAALEGFVPSGGPDANRDGKRWIKLADYTKMLERLPMARDPHLRQKFDDLKWQMELEALLKLKDIRRRRD